MSVQRGSDKMLSLLFSFSGRINRAKFWLGSASSLILLIALYVVHHRINVMISERPEAIPLPLAWGWLLFESLGAMPILVVPLWICFALSIKRFHDLDSTGWWSLILLVPVVGSLFWLIELGMIKGTPGDNKYGVDPLGKGVRS